MKVKSDCRFPAAAERFPLICVTCVLALWFMRNEICSPFKHCMTSALEDSNSSKR